VESVRKYTIESLAVRMEAVRVPNVSWGHGSAGDRRHGQLESTSLQRPLPFFAGPWATSPRNDAGRGAGGEWFGQDSSISVPP